MQTSHPVLGDFTVTRRILLLVAMALLVGTAGAFAAAVLMRLISLVSNLAWFGRFSTVTIPLRNAHPGVLMVLMPAAGGLIVGLMARYGSEKIRGHGIPEAIEAILTGNSRMQPKVAVLKPLSSAIAIGTGGPFGAEGPIIMTGGALGSLFAQFFHLSAAERKTLLVAGASAGMTAIFGTPVAAVLLAVELLLFEWKPRSFIPVAVAACVSALWRPLFFGTGPLFPVTATLALGPTTLLLCALAGIVAGLQSGLLTGALYKMEDCFESLPIHWMWWPMLGGLVVGAGALFEPRALGVGYDVLRDLLSNNMSVHQAGMILIVKAVIWVVALASGTSGGVLAPLMILGGTLGWLEGSWLLPGNHGLWALIGMAGILGGTMRAPLTATLFAVELTGDFQMLLPLLACTACAYLVTVLLLKRSILTEKIARRGQHVVREYSIDTFELMRAQDAMVSPVDTVPSTMGVDEAVQLFTAPQHRHKSYPVLGDKQQVVGMVSRADVLRWVGEGTHAGQSLYDVVSDDQLLRGYPDQTLGSIADLMVERDVGRVPIVERGTGRLLGLIARKDLLRIRATQQAQEHQRHTYLRFASNVTAAAEPPGSTNTVTGPVSDSIRPPLRDA